MLLTSNSSSSFHALTLSQTNPIFMYLQYKSFENTLSKGEIARYKQISSFPTVFSFFTCFVNFLPFSSNFKLSYANSFSLEEYKISYLGKG